MMRNRISLNHLSSINKGLYICFAFFLLNQTGFAQPDRWQQAIDYKMKVNLDVVSNQLEGSQDIHYTNHSPDTLNKIFFHTYWNAFQPGSNMDTRSLELGKMQVGTNRDGSPRFDWDARVRDRISELKPDEIGYTRFKSVKMDGAIQQTKEYETIVEVKLSKPILPGQTVNIKTEWNGQVPLQIRRSGRDNSEGIRYTMTQWYPKVAEYDYQGWNANPYIAREFYGVWGNFEVELKLNKDYKVAASGELKNANEIGWGYDKEGTELKPIKNPLRTWIFRAEKVHDFAWAADPDYKHIIRKTEQGPLLHFMYKNVPGADAAWAATADSCAIVYPFIKEHFGAYPWPTYSFIQGGDGGMEYAMATMVRSASIGTCLHEWMHSWYQQLMGTNESLYAWMDEGFTSYAESLVSNWMRKSDRWALAGDYRGYFGLVRSRLEEPMTTHADHFNTNYAYSAAAYSKGAVFVGQLGYIVGEEALSKIMLEYYRLWKFKHPNPNDFVRVAEKVSNLELQWYKEYWVNGTKTIDYKIDSIWSINDSTKIRISRVGAMPMPVEVSLTFKDGSNEMHYIPLDLMYGEKSPEGSASWFSYPAQRWTHRDMVISTNHKLTDVSVVEIDPSQRMADVERRNNKMELKW